jgi:BASS family bile acid:Na+ symporter
MTLAQLIPLLLQISVGAIVFSLGLQARPGDVGYLLRRPSLLLRSVLAMNIVMPILAAAIAAAFKLRPALEVALILLAVSPVPPILPKKETQAGGSFSYAIGLLAISAALAIVTVPASVTLIGRWFGHDIHVPAALIARILLLSVIGPLVAGLVVGRLLPSFAQRAAKPISMVSTMVLLLGFVIFVAVAWRGIVAGIGGFTVLAIVIFALVSLAVGHLLGGPAPEDRTVLALSTASRHPGVAIAVAGAIAPDERAIPATVLLAVLVGAIVTAPYAKRRMRAEAADRKAGESRAGAPAEAATVRSTAGGRPDQ